jgi:ABC-2 type transport system permease protein
MNNAKQFSAMFVAQIKMMFREKQVWFWNIFFPVILMVFFMIIFGGGSGGSSFKATIAVADPQPSAESAMLLEQLRQMPVLEFEQQEPVSLEEGTKWVEDKDIQALIVLPASGSGSELELIVNRENEMSAATQAISGILDKMVQQANLAAVGAEPVFSLKTSSVSSGSDDLSTADFLLTGMIGLSVAQGGLFGMVELVDMRKRGLMKRLRMTPANMGLYGLASMLVRFMLGIVQIIILTLIGVLGFGANLHINPFTLLVVFFAGSLVFNAMGYLFSSFSKTMEAYMGLANITSMLMMFLSGVFIPIETLPEWLQTVPKMLPLTYFVDGMREGMIYASGVAASSFWIGIGIMLLWGVVAFVVGAQVYRTKSIAETR